jgi:hypothetical protein
VTEPNPELLAVRSVRRVMSLRLAMWAGASMLLGLAMWLVTSYLAPGESRAFVEAFAAQFVGWGLVVSFVALLGLKQAQQADRSPANDANVIARELTARGRLVGLLRFNVKVLNFVLMVIAALLILGGVSAGRRVASGHGVGMLVQVTFLSLLERASLAALRRSAQPAAATGSNPI